MVRSGTALWWVVVCGAWGACTPRPGSISGEPAPRPDQYVCAVPDTARYAGNEAWYLNNEPIMWDGRRYTKYGPPRVLSPDGLRRAGEHQGVPFFVRQNTGGAPDVIYLPTRPGCEFHPYQWDLTSGGTRGRR